MERCPVLTTKFGVDFICLEQRRIFMRRAALMILIMLLCQPIVSGNEISSNEEYASDGTLDGDYTITNGNTLTVSGNYTIAENTKIIIQEGGELVVSGHMNATAPPELNLGTSASMVVPVGFLGESGTMRIFFADEILFGISIEINGNVTENWTGSEFDWNGDMDVENITVNITTSPFQISAISSIILSPQGDTPVIRSVEEIDGSGISLVIPDRNGAWTIEVYGTLTVSGTIFGADITCHGTCSLDGATMLSTGPIEVYGSISVTDSSLAGGVTDEDIIVWDDAGISWVNSSGTGGVTDNWVNILTTRTVGLQNGYISFYGYDMGYNSVSTSALSGNILNPGNSGDNIVDIAANERSRMVRWQDGNGVLNVEQASARIVLQTPWGDYEKEISELPRVNHFDLTMDLPLLNFDSLVESDNEGQTNSRLGVLATVSNEGDAPANFLIDCVSNGVDANVGSTIRHSIDAGETKIIPLNWDSPAEGELALECTIFVPYHFDGIDVVEDQSATSGLVTWSEETDESSNLVIPIVLGLGLGLGIFGLVIYNTRKKDKSYHVFEQEAQEDEELGTIE